MQQRHNWQMPQNVMWIVVSFRGAWHDYQTSMEGIGHVVTPTPEVRADDDLHLEIASLVACRS
jgi:hypothetical protein